MWEKRGLLIVTSGIVLGFQVVFVMVPEVDHLIAYFVGLGIGEAIYAATFWATIAYVVDKDVIGTAYGVIYATGNIALVVSPVIIGYIQVNTEKHNGHYWVHVFYPVWPL